MAPTNVAVLTFMLFAGAVVSVIVCGYAWRQKAVRGHRAFALSMLMVGCWSFAYAMELSVLTQPAKLFWAKLQYLSLPLTPTILVYASAASNYKWQDSWKKVLPLYIIPTLSNLFVWLRTPLIWSNISQTDIGGTMQLNYEYGPWFAVSILATYGMYIVAAGVILRLVFNSPRLSSAEAGALLVGASAPFLVNLLYIFRIDSLQGLDLTPLSLVTFGLVTAWVVFEIRPIDFLPIVSNAAFDSLPDPAMTVGVNNNVRLLNPAGEQQMIDSGRDLVKVRGNSIEHVMPAHWYELIKEPNRHETVTHEVTRDTDGKIDYFDMRITPLLDKRNRFKGRLFVIRDITKRKYEQLALAEREQVLAQAVREQTAELQLVNKGLMQAVRMKDEFLSGMSHELRTPLNAVIGTSESIHEGVYGELPLKLQEPLKRIDQSAGHLLELIEDILDMAKIEAGTLNLSVESVSLQEISDLCIRLVQIEATKKEIEIQLDFDVTQKVIAADKRRLRQILLNLLTNAIKFTPAGGQVGLILTENVQQQLSCLTVWDTGIGIADADQERIFNSFIQVDSTLARQYDGAGLGLALTRNFVTMHGGEITVTSTLNQGSRFTVSLPWSPTPPS